MIKRGAAIQLLQEYDRGLREQVNRAAAKRMHEEASEIGRMLLRELEARYWSDQVWRLWQGRKRAIPSNRTMESRP